MFVLEGPDLDFSALFDEDSTKNVKLKVFGKGYPKGFNCHAVVISGNLIFAWSRLVFYMYILQVFD